MSNNTPIEWCDKTWSPWLGCDKVSPGCKNCYITTTAPFRTRHIKHGDPRQRTSENYWDQAVRWNKAAESQSNRPRIFPSLCDWLDDEVPVQWLAEFATLVHDMQHLDWLLLTKRPELWTSRIEMAADWHFDNGDRNVTGWLTDWRNGLAPNNVWIGTSVEDQKRADERIPKLLAIPAKVRFLSVEPLLEEVDLRFACDADGECYPFPVFVEGEDPTNKIDWVIAGGESGKGARPCNLSWLRSIVTQCSNAGVPCFVKQLGATPTMSGVAYAASIPVGIECSHGYDVCPVCDKEDKPLYPELKHPKGGDLSEWPEDLRVRQFPTV